MKSPRRSFSARLALALAGLLLVYAALVAVLGRQISNENDLELTQRLSRGLAQHIALNWPRIALADRDAQDRAARAALLEMLMVVNPGVHVYVLDADGRVADYIGEPGMVRQAQVDLQPVRAFLAGAALPLRGTDPMAPPSGGTPRIFSAAMFAPRDGDSRPPGYLYIVLDGRAQALVAGQVSPHRTFTGAALVAGLALLATWALGAFALRRLTRPLHRLAQAMRDYRVRTLEPVATPPAATQALGDEVQAIAAAFADMTQRIETQTERERQQAASHREMMAGVAHDLRTPLTALHGLLEALAKTQGENRADTQPAQVLGAALSQSNKVRRLTQQLFELAALQSAGQVLQRERFSLDELVTDAVQKFQLADATEPAPRLTLVGAPPGRLELNGDLQLIERALTNLIDNAMRHAPGPDPVRVSLRRDGQQAQIWIEDTGPGLPADLVLRLKRDAPVADPPLRRSPPINGIGGLGGLGLAIAQRVAVLHGGSLRPLPGPGGGTRLCLALPLAV